MSEATLGDFAWKLPPLAVVFGGAMSVVALLVYLERKVSARIQSRIGPNRVGLLGPDGLAEGLLGLRLTRRRILGGLLQPLADVVKLFTKQDFTPGRADKLLYTLAPVFALLPPLLILAVLPVGAEFQAWGGRTVKMQISDLGVGLLWVMSVASLSAYGAALGGWASNSKYPLLGGVRAAAQLISYEIGMGLALLGAVMHYQSVSPAEMAAQQSRGVLDWGLFAQPLAFALFVVCAFAENNRLPFDLAEAEAELVGGYHTEYAGMKFGMFFQGEYLAMLALGAVTAAVFLGGWHYPGYAALREWAGQNVAALVSLAAFGAKVMLFILFQMWVRWTLPRFRFDQLMRLGWKFLIPAGLANLLLTLLLNLPA